MISTCNLCKNYRRTVRIPDEDRSTEIVCPIAFDLDKAVGKFTSFLVVIYVVHRCEKFEPKAPSR